MADEAPIYIRKEADKRISGDAIAEINLNKAACNGHKDQKTGLCSSTAGRRRVCRRQGTRVVEGGKGGRGEGQMTMTGRNKRHGNEGNTLKGLGRPVRKEV